MAKTVAKAKKFNPALALPEALEKPTVMEVLSGAGRSSSWGEPKAAQGLLALLKGELGEAEATKLLIEHANTLRVGLFNEARLGASPGELAWAQALIDVGADPFASEGERKNYDYKAGLFERLLHVGSWAYAKSLAAASEEAGQKAREMVASMGEDPEGGWGWEKRCGAWWRAKLFEEGGARGLSLAFELGVDPNQRLMGAPWVFWAKDESELEAFAKAGADLSAKDASGQGLREKICANPSAKAREGMLGALGRLGAKAGDEKEAAKALANLAKAGKWSEVSAQAKAAKLDPLTLKVELKDGEEPVSLLSLAMSSGNWELAAEMGKRGADLWQSCPLSKGGPAILAAAWGPSAPWSESKAKRDRQEGGHEWVLSRVDWSWRSGRGEKFLEAAKRAQNESQPSWGAVERSLSRESIKAAIKNEPMDASDPMWSRLSRMEPKLDWEVRCAALEREAEPWVDGQGSALLGKLVELSMSQRESSLGTGLVAFEQAAMPVDERDREREYFRGHRTAKPEQLDAWAKKLCGDDRQWISALEVAYAVEAAGDSKRQQARDALCARLRHWLKESQRLGEKALDLEALAPTLAWAASMGESGTRLCSMCVQHGPQQGGWVVLELVAKGWGDSTGEPGDWEKRNRAREAAKEVWRMVRSNGLELDFPMEHPLMSKPGAVDSRLAQDPLWVSIEEHVLARSSRPSRGPKA